MPRERIQHGKQFVGPSSVNTSDSPDDDGRRPYYPGEEMKTGDVLYEEPSLDVHWNRDGEYVQISIDAPRDWWERFWKSREDDSQVIAFAVFTDRLTRKEINNMIRTLRRARDTAYGVDE